jgi:hypothetical protein
MLIKNKRKLREKKKRHPNRLVQFFRLINLLLPKHFCGLFILIGFGRHILKKVKLEENKIPYSASVKNNRKTNYVTSHDFDGLRHGDAAARRVLPNELYRSVGPFS